MKRRLPPFVIDLLIAVGLLWLALVNRAEIEMLAEDIFTRDSDSFNTFLIVMQTIPLVLRRRYPQTVLFVLLGAFAVDRVLDYPSTFASAGMVLAFHSIGSELPRRRSAQLGFSLVGAVVVFTGLGAATLESVGFEDVVSTGLMIAVPLALGREVHQRRLRTQELEDRAERAERERESRAAQAVAEERSRIARELHDVVAHQMAVMTLQAEGARRLAGDADPRVAEALDTIRQTGHYALDEMRSMVGLLRSVPDDGTAELAPQPGLADLDRLVEQMRDAGLEVQLERRGAHRPLPGGLDLHAYRIVQESLTNALKHAGPGSRAQVCVDYGEEVLELEINDDGRGGNGSREAGGGHGLIGMRERVALLNGELTAGPVHNGFRVRATLPVGP
ncbi:MAG TPA: sensor histidine kinase [Acidimicrobiia bacterium]|nr:sensor histidine kinase [Acidimicrobiia bacterium]